MRTKDVAVSPKSFVGVWQTSSSRAEVARRTGLTLGEVLTVSSRYRARGVKLKVFRNCKGSKPRGLTATQVAELNRLIDDLDSTNPDRYLEAMDRL